MLSILPLTRPRTFRSGRSLGASCLLSALLLASLGGPVAADDCPCGPDGMPPALKRLVPQGFAGADFKPACRRHDACYGRQGSDKRRCDRQFLTDLKCACNHSRHPLMCRTVGRVMYASVRFGGSKAFQAAQQ